MFNFIYEYQDGYEPKYQDSIPICHAMSSSNAITTGDDLAGPESGLLSQLLQTMFGGTTVLGQVQVEEIIEDGIDVKNDMSLMEKADATTRTETDESLGRMFNLINEGDMNGGIGLLPHAQAWDALPDASKVL